MKSPSKKFNVNVKFDTGCGPFGFALCGITLTYSAKNAREAAEKAHWACGNMSYYGASEELANDKDVVFRVKERGTPKGKGITWISQREFL